MEQKVKNMSSAALAFLGDSVFEINIRNRVVNECEGSADKLNIRSKALTNAKAQAKMADFLTEFMTEEEMAVFKRGRNLKSLSTPKSCSISEYRRATGLEALMGHLYLENRTDRINELIDKALDHLQQDN